MTIYEIKPRFQNWLRPWCQWLAGRGVTANEVTVVAALGSVALGAVLSGGWGGRAAFLLLPPFLLLRMALNAIDGMLAREHGQKSVRGAFLNELGDVVSDGALLVPFFFVPGVAGWAVGAAMAGAVLTEVAGLTAVQAGASRRYDGPMGKSDRAVLLGIAGIWVGSFPGAGEGCGIILALMALLCLVTVVRRVQGALEEIRS